jgi:hypothetical protein
VSSVPPVDVLVVRRELLEMAAKVLRQNADLLRGSLIDLGVEGHQVDDVLEAIAHVTEDEYRSSENRGGS